MTAEKRGALSYQVEGPEGAPILVFLHGWPDEASLWRHQVEALRGRFRCVLPTLPNFGDAPYESGGCDFPEIVDRLHRTIESLGDEPVGLVTHDWGAYVGYMYEMKHPERVQTMAAMDVGGHFEPQSLKAAAMFVSYQWALAVFWLIGGLLPPIGTWLTRGLARLLKVPERQSSAVRSSWNYPYFYFWRATLVPWMRARRLGPYSPKCRVLFVYGAKKPLMFHTERWIEIVERGGGKCVGIEGASHWFMESHAAETNQLIVEWSTAEMQKTADP